MSAPTLAELLSTAGLITKTAAPVTKAAPAPAKVAAGSLTPTPVNQPANDRKAPPRKDATEKEPAGATGAGGSKAAPASAPNKNASFNEMGLLIENGKITGCDGRIYKTAAQQKLAAAGIFILDPHAAEATFNAHVERHAAAKTAELEDLATEARARGALQYHGMVAESTAMRLAAGLCDINETCKVAAMIGVDPRSIVKRAEAMQFDVERASQPGPALVGGNLGTAARQSSSRTMEAAGEARETVNYEPEGAAGTRQPVSGPDEKLVRFTDVYTLPGNPGLNLGMQVDQGKALGQ